MLCLTSLSGYMPFESTGNLEETNLILSGTFNFDKPGQGWHNVSKTGKIRLDIAKDFIKALIVVDPSKRLTSLEASKHEWLAEEDKNPTPTDLLPVVRNGFDATKTFKKAVGVVKAVYKLSNNNLNAAKNSNERLNGLIKSESKDSLTQAVFKYQALE